MIHVDAKSPMRCNLYSSWACETPPGWPSPMLCHSNAVVAVPRKRHSRPPESTRGHGAVVVVHLRSAGAPEKVLWFMFQPSQGNLRIMD